MRINQIKSSIELSYIFKYDDLNEIKEGYVLFKAKNNSRQGIYLITQGHQTTLIKQTNLSDIDAITIELERNLPMFAILNEIIENKKEVRISFHFFKRKVLPLRNLEIGFEDKTIEYIKKNIKRKDKDVVQFLTEDFNLRLGDEDYFFIEIGQSAENDFKKLLTSSTNDKTNEDISNEEDHSDQDHSDQDHSDQDHSDQDHSDQDHSDQDVIGNNLVLFNENTSTTSEKQAFCIYSTSYKIPIICRTINDKEYFMITRMFKNKHKILPNNTVLVKGSLSFKHRSIVGEISAIARSVINQAISDPSSYLNVWDKYVNMEGYFILKKAREINLIEIISLDDHVDTINVFVKNIPTHLSIDDILSFVNPIDQTYIDNYLFYLDDENMTWTEYKIKIDQNKKQIDKELRNEFKKISKRKLIIEKIDRKKNIITIKNNSYEKLETSDLLFLSISGDQTQIDRKINALEKLKTNQIANPNLANILLGNDENYFKPNQISHKKVITERLQKKIFKNEPTEMQKKAIDIALNSPDLIIVQGPPGTGKTTVITAILERLNEENKSEKLTGKVLVSCFQHDAIDNLTSRLSINSLPPVKFGGKSNKSDALDLITAKQIHWQDKIIKHVTEQKPEIKKSLQEISLENDISNYIANPTTRNALHLINQIKAINSPKFSFAQIKKINDLKRDLENELQATSYVDDHLVSMIRAIRTNQYSFADDGIERLIDIQINLNQSIFEVSEYKMIDEILSFQFSEIKDQIEIFKKYKHDLIMMQTRLLKVHLPKAILKVPSVRNDILEFTQDLLKILRQSMSKEDEISSILANYLLNIEANPVGVRQSIIDYSYVFAATTQQSLHTSMKSLKSDENSNYDIVIIDEAARATPLDLLIPMIQSKNKVILVGDHRQLPHILEDEIAESIEKDLDINQNTKLDQIQNYLEKSLFELLFDKLKDLEKKDNIVRTVTLDAQYRTHPILGNFISKCFYEMYGEGFRSPLGAQYFEHHLKTKTIQKECPLIWVNVPYSLQNEEKKIGTSRGRPSEAQKIATILDEILKDPHSKNLSIGVISFYSAQVQEILKSLESYHITQFNNGHYSIADQYAFMNRDNHHTNENEEKLRIDTVDAFQGKEFDIVILSIVRSKKIDSLKITEENKEKMSQSLFGHLVSKNRLCVSMSRQKKLLIVVGDAGMLAHPIAIDPKGIPELVAFYQLCQKEGIIIND